MSPSDRTDDAAAKTTVDSGVAGKKPSANRGRRLTVIAELAALAAVIAAVFIVVHVINGLKTQPGDGATASSSEPSSQGADPPSRTH